MVRVLSFVSVAALAACGGGSSAEVDAASPDAGALADAPPPRHCVLACTTPSDCGDGQPGTFLAPDHYTCDAGACTWLGCFSSEECVTTLGSSNYVCAESADFPRPRCLERCAAPDDCGVMWSCMAGACHYVGCSGSSDCAVVGSDFVCVDRECRKRCTTSVDCAGSTLPPPNEAANYACDDGACLWLGCEPTGCDALLGDFEYVCDPDPS